MFFNYCGNNSKHNKVESGLLLAIFLLNADSWNPGIIKHRLLVSTSAGKPCDAATIFYELLYINVTILISLMFHKNLCQVVSICKYFFTETYLVLLSFSVSYQLASVESRSHWGCTVSSRLEHDGLPNFQKQGS